MGEIYSLIFWIPAITSVVGLRVAWSSGLLGHPVLLLALIGFSLLLQLGAARFSPAWAIGLTAQVILAVYLGIRLKLEL